MIGRLGISECDSDRYGIGLEDEEGHFMKNRCTAAIALKYK